MKTEGIKSARTYNELPNDYWRFIEKNLPKYSSDSNVLRSDVLSRFIFDEEVCEEDFEWLPKTKEEAQQMLEEIDLDLYNQAVKIYNKEVK